MSLKGLDFHFLSVHASTHFHKHFHIIHLTAIRMTFHEKNWKRTPKTSFKKIVSHLSSSTKHPWTFSPTPRREKFPGSEFQLRTGSRTQIDPIPRFRHHEQIRWSPIILFLMWTSALLLVFDQKDCVLPSTGGHQYYTVLQLLARHLDGAPLIILLSCAKLQVGAHAPCIHRSWRKHMQQWWNSIHIKQMKLIISLGEKTKQNKNHLWVLWVVFDNAAKRLIFSLRYDHLKQAVWHIYEAAHSCSPLLHGICFSPSLVTA